MYYTLYRIYRDPYGPRKEKKASKLSRGVIREHVREEIFIYNYQHKGDQAIIDRIIFMDLKDTSQPFLR